VQLDKQVLQVQLDKQVLQVQLDKQVLLGLKGVQALKVLLVQLVRKVFQGLY
jgi:hypothetical protein